MDYARKVGTVLALASILVLSSIAAAQLLITNNNAALAQSSGITVSGTCDNHQLHFTVQGTQPDTFYYYTEIEESTGRVIESKYVDNFGSQYTTIANGSIGETYTLSWYQDFDGDYNDVGIEEDELVASDSVTCDEPPPPPPLDLTVSVNPTGTVNPRTGEVTLSGTVECSQDSEVTIVADLSQRAGRATISGSMSTSVTCTAGEDPIEWMGILSGSNGRFVAGRADVHVVASACDPQSGVCDEDQVSTTVRLRGSR